MTSVDLVKPGSPDDEPDEVVVRKPSDDELEAHRRATVPVARAVDPPATHLRMKDLIGIDLPARKVIVPMWARSWPDFKQVSWWVCRYCGHVATYHATRSHVYLGRVAVRSVRGTGRAVANWWRWVRDKQGADMALAAHDAGDQTAWKTARKEWKERTHQRTAGSAAVFAVSSPTLTGMWVFAPGWVSAVFGVSTVAVLTWQGKPEDKPLLDVVMSSPDQIWRMTSKLILEAYGGLGIGPINQALRDDPKGAITFVNPIEHDGPGWKVVNDLPKGVTAGDIVERREKLAAGLRRPLGCVWPEAVKGSHPGRVELFVADQDMNSSTQDPWPLAKSGAVDLFRPVPFGTDQRMRPVWITLMYASFIIGALPRLGKTFSLRLLLLCAALDVRAQLYVHDFKGSGDLSALEHVAHVYTVGDEEEDIQQALHGLRELRDEMRRRYKVLRDLPKDVAPETKVIPILASDPSLRLHPIVFAADECQFMFEHKKHGEEFEEIVTDLVKRGPAAGIMAWLATQRPDARSIPKGISDNAVLRFCLKVMEWGPNDMVLGSGRYKSGTRATMFAFEDKGVGYFVGEGADAQIVKSYYMDAPRSEIVAKRARQMRERAGTLSGYCIGQMSEPEMAQTLYEDLPRIFVSCERMHSETIVEELQKLRSGAYDGWTETTLAHAARDELGLITKGIKINGVNKQGLRKTPVMDAVEAKTLRQLEASTTDLDDWGGTE